MWEGRKIPWHMHLLLSRLKMFSWYLEKYIVIKIHVKIPSLSLSIFGQSTTFTRPMQIYMDVGVSWFHLTYPATLKKLY